MKNVAEQLREQSEYIDALQRRLDAVCEELTELKKWVGMPEWDFEESPPEEEFEDDNPTDWILTCDDGEEDCMTYYFRGKPPKVKKTGSKVWERFWSTDKNDARIFYSQKEASDIVRKPWKGQKIFPPGCEVKDCKPTYLGLCE